MKKIKKHASAHVLICVLCINNWRTGVLVGLCLSSQLILLESLPQHGSNVSSVNACFAASPPGLVCSGCRSRTPQIGWLKQQEFICPQFPRLGVPGQGAGHVGSWQELSSQPFLCVARRERALVSLPHKDIHPTGAGPSFYDLI